MIYECPVCKKKVNSISELKKCVIKHEADEATAAKGRINELETEINAKYEALAKLIMEYNKLNTEKYKTLSITTEKRNPKVNSVPVKIKERGNREVDNFTFLDSIDSLNDILSDFDNYFKNPEYHTAFNELLNLLNQSTKEDKKNA